MIDSTREQLKQYGVWSRQGVNIGRVKSCVQIFVESCLGGGVPLPVISDDEALLVNEAIANLTLSNAESAAVLCLFYVSGWPEYRIASERKIPRGRVKSLLSGAEYHVDCYLMMKAAA